MATLLAPSRADRAFERLYRRYVADVYRYVLAVLQNQADAEDATQTAFLSAYRAYERGERPERPLNWLIAIAHNVCRQRFRESARRPRLVELHDSVAARPSDEEAPNADEIRRALSFLAFNQRAALVMRELQGHSYEEIARILDLSTSAVETLLFRARRALREQLEGALTCGEAELALSKRADGELSFAERGQLRAHLRECPDCAALERRQRFRGRALRSLGAVPLPSSLGSFFGGGAAGTSLGLGAKAAAVVVAGVLGSSVAGDGVKERAAALAEPATAAPARPALVATPRSSEPRARTARRFSLRLRSALRRPVRRSVEAAPALVAPTPAQASPASPSSATADAAPAPAAAPSSAPAPLTLPESLVAAPDAPAVPAVPTLPGVPAAPVPALPPVAPPSLPALPAVPSLPTAPELPELTIPPVALPEAPRVDLPATETVLQP